MSDPQTTAWIAGAALAGLVVVALAGLRAWADWLALQRLVVDRSRPETATPATARIELADLRERVRKLEAIASGIDL